MAVDGYFLMQIGFIGERQNFQLYAPGIRTPKARFAAIFPPNPANTGQESSQIFVVSRWGEALSALHNVCCTNEVLREVRLDFWFETSKSSHADFTFCLSNANVINKRTYPNLDDESPKERGAKFLDPMLNRTSNYWVGFGFRYNSLQTKGLIPAHLNPILNFRN